MVTAQSLQDQVTEKVNEIKGLVSELSDDEAANNPVEGEWCVKEVLSHLIGAELGSAKAGLKRFLDEDTPQIDVNPGISYFEVRNSLSTAELLSTFEAEYGKLGEFLGGLSEEQLNRKANVPLMKESPIGEYPTLSQWAGALLNFHVNEHVGQIRNLCQ